MYKDDRDYVNMRLQGTVVRDIRVKKLTVVSSVGYSEEGLNATCVGLSQKVEYTVELSDLDLTSPPLGNIVFDGEVLYISRQPKRNDWRQGLRIQNLLYTRRGRTKRWEDNDWFLSLHVPIFNLYKSYRECVDLIDSGFSDEAAFGRIFSLDKGKSLWYKQRMKVGKDKNGTPTLKKNFSWLQEALDDELKD